MKNAHYFKNCTNCGFVWQDRNSFLKDVEIVGYQPYFKELQAGLFLFNHSCKGTISVKVEHFLDLYDGPIFQKSNLGSDECSGYCVQTNTLDLCSVQCECVFVREIIQKIKKF